jgi:hypothetical protein
MLLRRLTGRVARRRNLQHFARLLSLAARETTEPIVPGFRSAGVLRHQGAGPISP